MTRLARTLMIQGTASTVGKSTLVTGLCRILAAEGLHVAPFKAQNMALNSFVTRDGREMGRAQVVQAEAAGIEPRVEMNPVLLKPEGGARSQVIVMGRPLATLEARDYWRNRSGLLEIVRDALATLRRDYDLVIIEGAGSPVELNLARNDIVNMQVARLADAPVLLVGDIDRGGIFAALLGTLMLLPPGDRARVQGLIVNKFRGDLALWRDGERMLAERSGLPVLGTVPMFTDIAIAEEDSVPLEDGSAQLLHRAAGTATPLEIVVVRLPYLSNYDEFDALAAEPAVRLRFAAHPDEFPARPDLVILPGTKSTLHDLAWLWRQGLAAHIRRVASEGGAVFGICGGYQMLGERISDPVGAESAAGSVEPGLGLLPVETIFAPTSEKTTVQTAGHVHGAATRGLFAHLGSASFTAYQIHVGRTIPRENGSGTTAFDLVPDEPDGWVDPDGWRAGCYLHGLLENDAFRRGVLMALSQRRASAGPMPIPTMTFDRQAEYDKLAAWLRTHLDIDQLKQIAKLR
jgi:adenosylcobyric acid synthase